MEFKHTSVLFEECMEGLAIRPDGIYVDGTLGGGGHSEGIGSKAIPAARYSFRATIQTLRLCFQSWKLTA